MTAIDLRVFEHMAKMRRQRLHQDPNKTTSVRSRKSSGADLTAKPNTPEGRSVAGCSRVDAGRGLGGAELLDPEDHQPDAAKIDAQVDQYHMEIERALGGDLTWFRRGDIGSRNAGALRGCCGSRKQATPSEA